MTRNAANAIVCTIIGGIFTDLVATEPPEVRLVTLIAFAFIAYLLKDDSVP